MTSQQIDAGALQAINPTPIAELHPELPDISSRAIDGCITITWPFSASKRLLAFVLAEHDFRKRRSKGQVRIEFHGASGKALDKAKIANGDTVRLSLDGAEWQAQGPQPGLTGEPLGWQLKFSEKLLLSLTRLEATGSETINVDGEMDEEPQTIADDNPISPIPDFTSEAQEQPSVPQTPLMNVSTKRLASTAFDTIEEYVSPAFLKRAKVSYGSLFEGGFEALEEESARRNKNGRRKSRFSMPTAAWRYSSRSPSPSPEPEEPEGSTSEDEVPVAGLSFSAKRAPSRTPEPQPAMVDDSSQTLGLDQGSPSLPQETTISHHLDSGHIHTAPAKQPAAQLPGPSDSLQVLPASTKESIQSEGASAPVGELPVPINDELPLPSPMGMSFDFGLESAPLAHFGTAQGHPDAAVTTSLAQEAHLSTALGSGPIFDMGIQQHADQVVNADSEHYTSERDVLMHEAETRHSDAEISSSAPSHTSVKSQPQPVETIEILSSSPVQSPRARGQNMGFSAASWSHPEAVEAEAASDEDIEDEEHYEDEDAEGSAVDEADWTHDATPDDDADVPGEDYDLRKYDDAHEDDEEGNIDRDSLLSTDGEGNVIEANAEVISTGSGDSEEEEDAALDVDDEDDRVEVDVDDEQVDLNGTKGPDNVPESEVETSVSEASVSDAEIGDDEEAESDAEGIEDDEMGYEYEEEEYEEDYESDADEQMQEDPQTQEPVFIDLLSDSEEGGDNEGDEDNESSATPATPAAMTLSDLQGTPISSAHPVFQTNILQSEQQDDTIVEEPVSPTEPAQDVSMDDSITAVDTHPEDPPKPVAEDTEQDAQEPHILAASTVVDDQDMVTLTNEELQKDQEITVPAAEEDIKAAQTPVIPEDMVGHVIADSLTPMGASSRIDESTAVKDVVVEDQSLSEDQTVYGPSSGTLPVGEEQSTSQLDSTAPTYQTQPPMSFHDLGMTQSSLSTQTVMGGSPVPNATVHSPQDEKHPETTRLADEKEDERHAEATMQQFVTESQTQDAEPVKEVETAAGLVHEPSPGPDDQLYLEMQQREFERRKEAPPADEKQGHAITEEEELEAIENAAEHDPTLATKDYIITTDSLRSHDHHDVDATRDVTKQDESQTTLMDTPGDQTTEQHKPMSTLKAPPRRSHRKTRSSGSIDLSTGDLVNDSSQETATQQLSQETHVSQELGTVKTPIKSRATRRRRAVQDLDTDIANTSQDSSSQELGTRSLRSSPRGHKRVTSGVLAEQDGPNSPSGEETPQKTEKATSSKSQLLRMLQSDLPEFLSLNVLRNSLHKTVDILAIAAVTPSAPVRPKNGPRDYMLELILTDPSTAPSTVSVAQIYRPHQKSLPVVKAGDVVLLRRFQVLSMKGRGFGIRAGDDSAWAVFEKADEEKLPQIMGPPVEVTEEEVMYVMGLAGWWEGMGEEAWRKAEKAGEKVRVVSGEPK